MRKGLLLVVSGPSGAGKGVICKRVLEMDESIALSVSCTTRMSRVGEIDGENYFFLTERAFKKRIDNDGFLEYAQYMKNYYGTPKDEVVEKLKSGTDVILEIEVQGALKVKEKFSDALLLFVVPPSLNELEKRLRHRGTETEEQTKTRLAIAEKEIELLDRYDYVIKNDKIEKAAKEVLCIISAEKNAVNRNLDLPKRLKEGETLT